MPARIWRRRGTALVAALLAAGSLALAAPVGARPAAACPADAGITVVVDFGPLGGGVQIRCVTQTVTSGFDALTKAGFAYTTTQRFGGLLCRIDAKPADEPCVHAPPADRYWAYWTADAPGGAWTYSGSGGGNRVPPPGSVEGWAFSEGCDRTPGSGPCPSASTTTTKPPTTPTTSGVSAPPTSTTVAPVDPSTTTTTAAEGATSSTGPPGARAPEPGAEGADEVALGAGPAAATGDDADDAGSAAGSAAGALVGGLAVLAIGGAGALTARRRRTSEEAVG